LRLKCPKFDFRWGSALDPAGGAYSAHTDSLAVLKRPTSKRRKWGSGRRGGEKKKKRKREEGKGGKGRAQPQTFWPRTPLI